jgi:putative pyruvate formate lyase activating enzyme
MAAVGMNVSSFSKPVQLLWERMSPCVLCPRRCRVDRTKGDKGVCGVGETPKVSSIFPHFGEERVLVGVGGSGTIFFTGCNLRCIFCQNYDISHLGRGQEMSVEDLGEAMIELQREGCCNINLVTPTHVAAAAAAAIEHARNRGLRLPVVYNTGGYDSTATLELLEGFIDIYMPDMKYGDGGVGAELSEAADYPEVNRAAVKEMHRQVGDLKTLGGAAVSGLLVRHLVLPNRMAGSFQVIDFLANEISNRTAINIMDQYRPCYKAGSAEKINRRPFPEEIEEVRSYAIEKGLRVIH